MSDHPPQWLTKPPRAAPGNGKVFLTTDRYPLFYLQITKCGCTFVRNLLYLLDNDAPHPDGGRIHSYDDAFVKSTMVPLWLMRKSPYLFTVIRDPVDRFLSLYFDKIADTSNQFDQKMRARITELAGLLPCPDTDLACHRDNCLRTLDWLDLNLSGKTKGKVNPHWGRQSNRLKRAKMFDLTYLTLDGLSGQLSNLLSPLIPDIEAKMAAVHTRNASAKIFTHAEIMTPEIEQKVQSIYPQDTKLYQQVSAGRADAAPAGA